MNNRLVIAVAIAIAVAMVAITIIVVRSSRRKEKVGGDPICPCGIHGEGCGVYPYYHCFSLCNECPSTESSQKIWDDGTMDNKPKSLLPNQPFQWNGGKCNLNLQDDGNIVINGPNGLQWEMDTAQDNFKSEFAVFNGSFHIWGTDTTDGSQREKSITLGGDNQPYSPYTITGNSDEVLNNVGCSISITNGGGQEIFSSV